jgi:hypothetical protein
VSPLDLNYDPAAIERPDVLQACLEDAVDEIVVLGTCGAAR